MRFWVQLKSKNKSILKKQIWQNSNFHQSIYPVGSLSIISVKPRPFSKIQNNLIFNPIKSKFKLSTKSTATTTKKSTFEISSIITEDGFKPIPEENIDESFRNEFKLLKPSVEDVRKRLLDGEEVLLYDSITKESGFWWKLNFWGWHVVAFFIIIGLGNTALMIWERPLVESQDILKSNNNDDGGDGNNIENERANKARGPNVPYKFLIIDSKEKKIAMVSAILAFVAFSSYILLQVPRSLLEKNSIVRIRTGSMNPIKYRTIDCPVENVKIRQIIVGVSTIPKNATSLSSSSLPSSTNSPPYELSPFPSVSSSSNNKKRRLQSSNNNDGTIIINNEESDDNNGYLSIYMDAFQTKFEKKNNINVRKRRWTVRLYYLDSDNVFKTVGKKLDLNSTWSLKRHAELFGDDRFADVTFRLDCGSTVKASKILAAAHSRYFKNLLSGDWAETRKGEVVEIKDVSKESFKLILYYFYSGKISISPDNDDQTIGVLKETYIKCDMWGIDRLLILIREQLIKRLSKDNWDVLLLLSYKFDDKKLKDKILSFISKNYPEIDNTINIKRFVDEAEVEWVREMMFSTFFDI
ncbi:3642_t:CDS:2 [Entrophospora sp. SA101]|nr:11564_t:CDS:2 [Entrophospora sp. SA101]CAJ0893684.1 3642_t:CDS:2 [Entrophospora sp. SA101]